MVAEFKKEAVLKEISRLNAEVEQGKRIIEEAEERKKEEDDILNSLGVTMQQVKLSYCLCSKLLLPTQNQANQSIGISKISLFTEKYKYCFEAY